MCLSYRQSIELSGVSCYFCRYSFFPSQLQKSNWKKSENLQKIHFRELDLSE